VSLFLTTGLSICNIFQHHSKIDYAAGESTVTFIIHS
jgi:hypothetical protein